MTSRPLGGGGIKIFVTAVLKPKKRDEGISKIIKD